MAYLAGVLAAESHYFLFPRMIVVVVLVTVGKSDIFTVASCLLYCFKD